MSSTKKTIYIISTGCLVFMFTFFKLFLDTQEDPCLFLGILFMTAAYHLIVRLVIGTFADGALENGIDPENHWFADSDAEQAAYRAIGVKRWKNKLPTPDAWKFSIKRRSLEDVIAESCRTEVVHEAGAVASLLTVLLTIPFGYLWFFILTAAIGAVFDLVFVMIQRYNRPRLMRAAAKKRMRFFDKLAYDTAFDEFKDAEDGTVVSDESDVNDVSEISAATDNAGEDNDESGDSDESDELNEDESGDSDGSDELDESDGSDELDETDESGETDKSAEEKDDHDNSKEDDE